MTRKTTFFDGWSWFKFVNLGLAVTFLEVLGEKLVGGLFAARPPSPKKCLEVTKGHAAGLSMYDLLLPPGIKG